MSTAEVEHLVGPGPTRLRVAAHLPEHGHDLVTTYLTSEPLRPWFRLELAHGDTPPDVSVVGSGLLDRVGARRPGHRLVVMVEAGRDDDLGTGGHLKHDVGGLVLAGRPLAELGWAIMVSATGGVWIAPPLWDRVRDQLTGGVAGAGARAACEGLTRAERRTLMDVAEGLTNRQIAAKRRVAVRTVKFHVENLLAKTGCDTRSALAALAFQAGFVDVSKTGRSTSELWRSAP